MRYLHHVTLTTGHVRRSPRGEVDDGVIEVCAGLLDDAISGGEPLLPHLDPPCTLTATAQGRCCVVTVWTADESAGKCPLLTIGIAGHSRCGSALWRLLHEHAAMPIVTDIDQVPPEPWVAGRIDIPRYTSSADLWLALGDMERCLGWAWLDRAMYCERCQARVVARGAEGDLLCPRCALMLTAE